MRNATGEGNGCPRAARRSAPSTYSRTRQVPRSSFTTSWSRTILGWAIRSSRRPSRLERRRKLRVARGVRKKAFDRDRASWSSGAPYLCHAPDAQQHLFAVTPFVHAGILHDTSAPSVHQLGAQAPCRYSGSVRPLPFASCLATALALLTGSAAADREAILALDAPGSSSPLVEADRLSADLHGTWVPRDRERRRRDALICRQPGSRARLERASTTIDRCRPRRLGPAGSCICSKRRPHGRRRHRPPRRRRGGGRHFGRVVSARTTTRAHRFQSGWRERMAGDRGGLGAGCRD